MKGFLKLEPGWVVVLCALYYFNPLEAFWPFAAAVVCHELGHAAALFAMDVPIRQLRLELAGAALVTGPMDYRREIICALAGPAASLIVLALRRQFPMFAALSLLLAVFNLLPVYPLDGGRALRAALLLRCDEQRAGRIMTALTVLYGAGLLGGALYLSVRLCGGLWPVLAAAALVVRIGLGGWREEN